MATNLVKNPALKEALEKDPTAGPRPLSIEEYRQRKIRQEEERRCWELRQPATAAPKFITPVCLFCCKNKFLFSSKVKNFV